MMRDDLGETSPVFPLRFIQILDMTSEVQEVRIATHLGRPAARCAVLVLTRPAREKRDVAGQHLDKADG